MNISLRNAWLIALLSAFLYAQAQNDTLRTLQDVEVMFHSSPQGIVMGDDGSIRISPSSLSRGIHVLGEADALRSLTMLPGVNSGSDYSGGMTIGGADYSQNVFTIDGARVFFPYHFGGIFSVFNTSHITSLQVGGLSPVASPSSLGEHLSVSSPGYVSSRMGISAHVGLLSSSASVKVPCSDKIAAFASARVSYINALYGNILTIDENSARYGFKDLNLTVFGKVNENDCLKFNVFANSDRLNFDDDNFVLTTQLGWQNLASSASYVHQSDSVFSQHRLSASGLWSKLDLDMSQFTLKMPSSILNIAGDGRFEYQKSGFDIGYRVEYSHYKPQRVTADGVVSSSSPYRSYDSWLLSAEGRKCLKLVDKDKLYASVKPTAYVSDCYWHFGIDPKLTYVHYAGSQVFRVSVDASSQYMHQVGFSDIGLASNFWLPSYAELKPQRSFGLDCHYSRDFSHGISISAQAFARRVYDVPEYNGDVLSVVSDFYNPFDALAVAHGYNIGGDVTLRYDSQVLSGWIGNSLTVCRRKFSDNPDKWVSSASEPLYSLKAFADLRLSRPLSLSAYFVMASGRPYTPVNAVFIVGGNVLTEYGDRNSARLPVYHRLDLSATYRLKPFILGTDRIESFVNLSLINAYGHENVEMQYFTYNHNDNTIYLRRVSSLYRFLPSLSYSIRF